MKKNETRKKEAEEAASDISSTRISIMTIVKTKNDILGMTMSKEKVRIIELNLLG